MPERSRLRALAESRKLPAFVLVAGLLISLPVLRVGLYSDDFLHRAIETQALPGFERGTTELYDFTPEDGTQRKAALELGGLPWWTGDDLHLRFFRPIPSALLVGEMRLFGDALWPPHVHGLLWFAGLLLLATALLRRFLSPPTAAIASLTYALSVVHTTEIGWLAARYSLMAATLGLATVWAHVRAREDGWKPGVLLAPLLLIVALLCGESAVVASAMILFYELLGADQPLRRRLAAALPVTIITLVYLAWYRWADYGMAGSGVYVDPFAAPIRFATQASWRIPALLGNMLMAVPSEVGFSVPESQPVLATIGLFGAACFGVLAWRLRSRMPMRERRTLRWMLPAALLATIPFAAGPPGGRVLPIVMLGASALIAAVATGAWRAREASPQGSRWRRRWWAAAAGAVVLLHLGLSPLIRVAMTFALAEQSDATWRLSRSVEGPCAREMYIPAASDPTIFFYAPVAATIAGTPPPEALRVLSMAPQDHRIENVRPTGFDLVVVGPRRLSSWEQLFREDALQAGEVFELRGLKVRVLEVERGWPTRLRLEFGRPLSSPTLCFVRYHEGRYEILDPPQVGETLELPREIGPSGM